MNDNIIMYLFGCATGFGSCIILYMIKQWVSNQFNENLLPLQSISPLLKLSFTPPANADSCLVCLEDYTNKQAVIECTSCHVLIGHASCSYEWFQRNLSCPHCRVEI